MGVKSFYSQLTPQPYDQFRFSLMANVPHLREMMGARYVLCGTNNSPIDGDAKEILATEGYRLYENPHPMGRLTLLHRVAGLANAYVTAAELDTARKFLGKSASLPHLRDRIVNTVNQPNRTYSTVESDSTSLLVLNEWFTPARKVRVNGKNRPVLRVNEWQTAALLPAWKNRVEFEYRPMLFRVLMALNRITIVLLLLFVILAVVRNARASSSKRQSPDQLCS